MEMVSPLNSEQLEASAAFCFFKGSAMEILWDGGAGEEDGFPARSTPGWPS